MRYKILKTAFFVWIALWLFFLARELFVKGQSNDYKHLLFMSLEEKHSYVTGERLYEFIAFCKKALPDGASYRMIGLEDGSLDKRRASYYLYGLIEKDDARYLLVFDEPDVQRDGYRLFAKLDEKRYILKSKGDR